MATKNLATWQKEAQALAKKIGKDAPAFADDVKVEDVQKLVSELQDELLVAEAAIDKAAQDKKPAIAFEFYVADGKSITSKRGGRKGMLHAGDEMKVEYLGGGLTALKSLIKRGVVVKNESFKK